ncbi:MobA/MobL family protein [Azospirillum sp. A23]|uniref:MobA/MobL family protein n=1 Tax=Azospirillum sp. A23 TaxID=3160608 RepID=UPI0036F1A942
MDEFGFYRIEQGFVTRSPLTSAAGAAAYQAGDRFRSVLAAAAYQAGSREAADEEVRTTLAARGLASGPDVVFDYTAKGGVYACEIRTPPNAPDWCRERQRLWSRVETTERRRDAALALRYEIALSRGVPIDLSIRHLRGFVDAHLVARGLVADVAIHLYGRPLDPRYPHAADQLAHTIDPAWPIMPVTRVPNRAPVDGPHVLELPDGRLVIYQPHAHVLATTRPLQEGGFGAKDRALWKTPFLLAARQGWERACNASLQEAGLSLRVSQKSKWRRRKEGAVSGADDRLLSQVPLGPGYHAVMNGRAVEAGETLKPHAWNRVVAEFEKAQRLAPEGQARRLAAALARISQLERDGVRFAVGPGRTLRIDVPDGATVGWQDRALWSGVQGLVADYLEARGQARADAAAERPAHPDTDRPDEAQRLRASLAAVDAAVVRITKQTNKPTVAAGDLAERVLAAARGAMTYAYARKDEVLRRERQARLDAADSERLQAGKLTALERALEQEREERQRAEQSLATLRLERDEDRRRSATREAALRLAKTAAADAEQHRADGERQHERARNVLERVRSALGGDVPDDRLVESVMAIRQRADGVDAALEVAAMESGPAATDLPADPVLRITTVLQARADRALATVAGWLDGPVRALGVELQGPPAARILQAIAVLETTLASRAAELEQMRRERDLARAEAEGWRRAFWRLVRGADRLLGRVGDAGLVAWATGIWQRLVAAVRPDRSAAATNTAPLGGRCRAPDAGAAARRRELDVANRLEALTGEAGETGQAAVIRILRREDRPIGAIDGALRPENQSAAAVAAFQARLVNLDDRRLAAHARATADGARLSDDVHLRQEYERGSRMIDAEVARRQRERARRVADSRRSKLTTAVVPVPVATPPAPEPLPFPPSVHKRPARRRDETER